MNPLDDVLRLTVSRSRKVLTAMAADIRAAIRRYRADGADAVLAAVRKAVKRNVPDIGEAFGDGLLAAWIAAAQTVGKMADKRPPAKDVRPAADPISYPMAEKAVEWLQEREFVPANAVRAARGDNRRQGLLIGHAVGDLAVEAIRKQLVTAIEEGSDVRRFVAENEGLDISGNDLVTIYRTNIAEAYKQGQRAILSEVDDEFPYVLYTATHDGRTEDTHLAMERLGLNHGPVYRADDPVAIKFWPPWRWNCRCHFIPLSVEDAAIRGVREAKLWTKTGEPPAVPEHVPHPPFDLPPGWQ